jgi:hypothetical protein
MTVGRGLWLGAMVAVQASWFLVRGSLTGEPIDASMGWIVAAALAAGVVAASPAATRLRRLLSPLAERPRLATISVAALGFAVGAFSATVQPAPVLDEAFVQEAARSVADDGVQGLVRAYRENEWLARRHPPLGPVVFGVGLAAGLDLHGLRLVSAALLGLTAALTAVIAHGLYGMRTALRAGALLATLPLLARMSGIAMNELLVTALATATVLLALSAIRAAPPSRPLAYGAALGAAIGAAILVKYTMTLLAPAALGLAIVHRRVRELWKTLAVAFAIAAFVFAGWWLALDAMGSAGAQLDWLAYGSRAGLGSSFGRWSTGQALATKLPSAIGLYQLPLLLVGLWTAWGKGRPEAATLLVWIATISIPLLLTLPENRYFLPAFPAVAILLALGLERLPSWRHDVLLLALLLCLVTVAYYGSLEVRTPAELAF